MPHLPTRRPAPLSGETTITAFIINLTEHADGNGVRAQIQRFDGETITAYDMALLAAFRDGGVQTIRIFDKEGNDL